MKYFCVLEVVLKQFHTSVKTFFFDTSSMLPGLIYFDIFSVLLEYFS